MDELIRRATGEALNPQWLRKHLGTALSEITALARPVAPFFPCPTILLFPSVSG